MQQIIEKVFDTLKGRRLNLTNEKALQIQIDDLLKVPFAEKLERERIFNKVDIPDFFIDGVCIEVKIKGQKRAIYRQCVRYCELPEVKSLILVTGIRMGFPKEINEKPCYVFNITQAWL